MRRKTNVEVIHLPLPRASGVFTSPLVSVLPLVFGLRNLAEALECVRGERVLVNDHPVQEDYVLSSGDVVVLDNQYGVFFEETL